MSTQSVNNWSALSALPSLCVVIPVFNEASNVEPLAAEVIDVLAARGFPFEVVFVDDGSDDGTEAAIVAAHQWDGRVRGCRHAANAGQSTALWTGLGATSAPWIATMDGDRQNDPSDLPRMLDALSQADFVCGIRTRREDHWLRRASSVVARWARRIVLGVDFRDTGCALRVFRRTVLDGIVPFNGWHRLLPVLVHAAGHRVIELPVGHRARVAGRSKYGVWNRLGRGAFDLIGVAWLLRRRLHPPPTRPCE